MAAVEYLIQHPEIKHGKIRIAFNPDEEIGRGAHKFNVGSRTFPSRYSANLSCPGVDGVILVSSSLWVSNFT